MKKNYTAEQLLQMAVRQIAVDPGADLDGDHQITAADARLAARGETGEQAAPEYKPDETLTAMRGDVLDRLMREGEADFDVNADSLYRQYRDLYTDNAGKAARDVYGLASAATGGYGSSYAATAASAAYDRYMQGLTDRALDITEAARKQQGDARADLYDRLQALNALEESDYGRYRDRLSLAFNAAKQGDYSLLEDLGMDASALRRGDVTDLAELAAKYGDYGYLSAMGVDTSALTGKEATERAVRAAQYGDYSYLEALGVDTSDLRYEQLLQTAATLAEYGDYSALEQLGVNVDKLKQDDLLERAVALAGYGDYSLLGTLSQNEDGLRQKVSASVQKGAEAAYAAGGYPALSAYLDKQVGYGQLNALSRRQVMRTVTGGRYED